MRIERRLPDVLINIFCNAERRVDATRVFDRVNPGLANRREVEKRIGITHPVPPRLYIRFKDLLVGTLRGHAQYPGLSRPLVERIEFDDRDLIALRRVTDL